MLSTDQATLTIHHMVPREDDTHTNRNALVVKFIYCIHTFYWRDSGSSAAIDIINTALLVSFTLPLSRHRKHQILIQDQHCISMVYSLAWWLCFTIMSEPIFAKSSNKYVVLLDPRPYISTTRLIALVSAITMLRRGLNILSNLYSCQIVSSGDNEIRVKRSLGIIQSGRYYICIERT